MDRWDLFNLYIYPELVAMKKEYSASSVFIMGSFLQEKMWKLGLSDIDIVLLSNKDVFYKSDLDITDKCSEYVTKQKLNFNDGKFSIRLSYVVWNEDMFFKSNAWEHYWKQNKIREASIIEDQLLFSASNKLVLGEEKRSISVDPTNYRTYLAERYNHAVLPDEIYITLLSEVKRIIYACRIFHYLWTGCYIYPIDKLLNEVTTTFTPNLVTILTQAVEAREQMSNNLGDLIRLQNNYFADTRKFHRIQKEVVNELLALDRNYSKIALNANFVDELY